MRHKHLLVLLQIQVQQQAVLLAHHQPREVSALWNVHPAVGHLACLRPPTRVTLLCMMAGFVAAIPQPVVVKA